jgi:hypothetical protein
MKKPFRLMCKLAETAKNSSYVQESLAGVAYGLGCLLALDNPWGGSLLDQKTARRYSALLS